jgi:hypothetical protein
MHPHKKNSDMLKSTLSHIMNDKSVLSVYVLVVSKCLAASLLNRSSENLFYMLSLTNLLIKLIRIPCTSIIQYVRI